MITPLAWSHTGPDGASAGFAGPAYWKNSATGSVQGFFPVAGDFYNARAGTRTTYAFNMVRRVTDRRDSFAALPLYYSWQNRVTGASGRVLVPLGFNHVTPESATTLVLPAYFSHVTPERSVRAFLPVAFAYGNTRTQRAWSLILPLYFKYANRATGYGMHQVALVYWAVETPERTVRVLPPFLAMDTKDGMIARALLPVWWYSGSPMARTYALFPLYFGRRTADSYLHVTPLFFAGRHQNTWDFGMPLGPLAGLARTGAAALSVGALLPFYATPTSTPGRAARWSSRSTGGSPRPTAPPRGSCRRSSGA
ncbi:MAG: hypothetical protein ABIF71_03450 [Planctomycetota bacterium]